MHVIVNSKQGRLGSCLSLLPSHHTGGATSAEAGVSFSCYHTEHGGSEEEGAGGGRRERAHEDYYQRNNGGLGGGRRGKVREGGREGGRREGESAGGLLPKK